MATNMYKAYDKSKTREWDVVASQLPASANAVPGGTVIKNILSGQIGVTLAASGGSTRPAGIPGVTGGTVANSGVGYQAGTAVVAVDGSWLLSVAGVTAGATVPDSAAGTNAGTPVFQHNTTGAISTTATGGTRIGVVDDGVIIGLITPVKIGV